MTDTVSLTPPPTGTAVTHLDALPPGTRLGEFELRGLLGVGGFGMVYQAYDHSLHRDVAIKEYMPSSLARRSQGAAVSIRSSVDAQTFDGGLKSFMAEARLLAQFDHASLVKVFRFWEENNTAYMVMPFYRGITLKQARLQMRSPPPEEWLRKVLWSVLGALKVLHNGNTMHRDISPENIFLQDIGPPVLLDLGAARRAIGEKNQQLTATLKFSYAPIEQYGESPDMRQGPWTDLYALASVIHACLANELPLPATLRVIKDRLPSFASVVKQVEDEFGLSYSSEFVLTIEQALSVRPADRPKSASTFARLMDLRVPSGMSRFDWRAELGDIYVPPAASSAPPTPSAGDETVVLQATEANAARKSRSAARRRAAERGTERVATAPAAKARPVWIWPAAALALVGSVALAWGLLRANHAPTTATPPPSVVLATPPSASPASEAVAAAASAPETPAFSASAPTPEAPQLTATLPDNKASAARKLEAARRAEKKPVATTEPPRTPTPGTVSASSSPAPSAAESARAATAAASARPAPASTGTPEANCADRNFVTRPMCVFQECQKPEFVNLPFCVENARRLRESRSPSN